MSKALLSYTQLYSMFLLIEFKWVLSALLLVLMVNEIHVLIGLSRMNVK